MNFQHLIFFYSKALAFKMIKILFLYNLAINIYTFPRLSHFKEIILDIFIKKFKQQQKYENKIKIVILI